MAGVRVEIEVQDKAVTDMLAQLLSRLSDPGPALAQIGEFGMSSTRERIEGQNADPIASWAPLSERYLASHRKQKSKGAGMVLVLDGYLVSFLRWQSDSHSVEWGTNAPYAAAQQFGRPEINLPARPFLGLTERDTTTVLGIMQQWLQPS